MKIQPGTLPVAVPDLVMHIDGRFNKVHWSCPMHAMHELPVPLDPQSESPALLCVEDHNGHTHAFLHAVTRNSDGGLLLRGWHDRLDCEDE